MTRRWALRITVTVLSAAATVSLMALFGMDPRPALLAAVAVAAASAYWMTADVAAQVEPARWTVHRGDATSRGRDTRVDHLRWRLAARPESAVEIDTVVPLLAELIDDRVATRYGVDRASDPDAFDRLVGPELAAFVTAPPSAARTHNPQYLAGILTRIEAL